MRQKCCVLCDIHSSEDVSGMGMMVGADSFYNPGGTWTGWMSQIAMLIAAEVRPT